MRRCWRGEAAQALPLGLLLLMAFLILIFGVMGMEVGIWTRIELQGAADAGTRAASAEAVPYARLAVTLHQESCSQIAGGQQPNCSDGPPQTVNVEGLWWDLFGTAGGPPGWAARAGCAAVGQASQHDGDLICTGWHLLAWGWRYPAGAEPRATAVRWLETNTANLTSSGKTTLAVLDVAAAADGTGRVAMHVRATEAWNPLSVVIGKPVTVTVASEAQPVLSAPLPQSGR